MRKLHFPEAPRILVEPPGPRSTEYIRRQLEIESSAVSYPRAIPLAFEEGRGATLRDADGNVYIDFFGGAGVLNVGNCNPEVLRAVRDQVEKLTHALDFPTAPRLELSERLLEIAPLGLRGNAKILFCAPTGSDAVEASVKLARYNTGRHPLLSFEGGYHGMTAGAVSLSSGKKFKERYVPLYPEVHFAPYAYCYRCAFGREWGACDLECATYVEHLLEDPHSGVVDPAAMVVEAVQGEGGSIPPPEAFISELRRICDDYDVPLIIDEIQAGLGRTGRMFACEHSGATPDIMTVSKGIGGGLPLSAVIYNEKLDTWERGAHIGTFRGHALAMAAGVATLNFMGKYDLPSRAARIGQRMLRRLEELKEESRYIGDVRGKGLMIGVEFVKDKGSKEPGADVAGEVRKQCYKRGLIVELGGHYLNVVRFLPPLVLTEELADKGLDIMVEAVEAAERTA